MKEVERRKRWRKVGGRREKCEKWGERSAFIKKGKSLGTRALSGAAALRPTS